MDSGDSSILDPSVFTSLQPPSLPITCAASAGGAVDLTQKNVLNVIEMSSLLQNFPHPNFPPPSAYSNDVFNAFKYHIEDNYNGSGEDADLLHSSSNIAIAAAIPKLQSSRMTPSLVLNNKSSFEKSFRPFADSYPIKNILF